MSFVFAMAVTAGLPKNVSTQLVILQFRVCVSDIQTIQRAFDWSKYFDSLAEG